MVVSWIAAHVQEGYSNVLLSREINLFSWCFVIFSTLLTFTQLDSDFKSTWKIFYWCSNYDFVFPGQLFGSDAPCSGFETRSAVQAVTTLLSFSLLPFVQQAHPCLMLLDTHIQTRIKHTHIQYTCTFTLSQTDECRCLEECCCLWACHPFKPTVCVCQCLVCTACLTLRGFPNTV